MTNIEKGLIDGTIFWQVNRNQNVTILAVHGMTAETEDDVRRIVQYLAKDEADRT